jgi:hypothetical protein
LKGSDDIDMEEETPKVEKKKKKEKPEGEVLTLSMVKKWQKRAEEEVLLRVQWDDSIFKAKH